MKAFRIRHPKIYCFGMMVILSWRNLRNSSSLKGSPIFPFLPKNRKKFPRRKLPSLYQKENILVPRDGELILKCTISLYKHTEIALLFHEFPSWVSWSLPHDALLSFLITEPSPFVIISFLKATKASCCDHVFGLSFSCKIWLKCVHFSLCYYVLCQFNS